jgi:thiol-disulfide isomerase/thioredoxin
MAYMKAKFAVLFIVVALVAGGLVGCKKSPANNENQATQQQTAEPNSTVKSVTPPANDTKPTLENIIAKRRGWGPAYKNWVGKDAPDFTVTDINGQKHTLSEYRGKNVMLIFWATWCGPCIAEIPHLIELRKKIGEDKLAMLAISYIDFRNTTEAVKRFVAANPIINYTVTSTDISTMPRPYNLVNGIPCSFFIDPNGKIKLATEGMMPLPKMKAIIEAER